MTSNSENQITRSDLIKSAVNTGALGMEFSWTYYKQMNIAFCLMLAKMLKKNGKWVIDSVSYYYY